VRELVGVMQRRAFEHMLEAYADEPHPEEHGPDVLANERLGELAMPILVLVGDLDQDDFGAIADRIRARAQNARLVRLDGVAHLPSMERPELFAELVLAYLDELGL